MYKDCSVGRYLRNYYLRQHTRAYWNFYRALLMIVQTKYKAHVETSTTCRAKVPLPSVRHDNNNMIIIIIVIY